MSRRLFWNLVPRLTAASSTAFFIGSYVTQDGKQAHAASQLPVYRRSEIMRHVTMDKGIWVTYEGNVYDITKFVANHPGGRDKISLAAGNDIGPYWKMYPQHINSKLPMETLSPMIVGTLHPEDAKKEAEESAKDLKGDLNDPFTREPDLSPLLTYHMRKPYNAEAPSALLSDSWITPNHLWFVRNHHPTPIIEDDDYVLTVSGRGLPHGHVDRAVTFTLNDLQTKFNKTYVTSTVQCGGNRRNEMNKVRKTFGAPWESGAMSTAKWGGVLLSDLLKSVGVEHQSAVREGIEHIQFVGAEGMEASIPVYKALNPWGDVRSLLPPSLLPALYCLYLLPLFAVIIPPD